MADMLGLMQRLEFAVSRLERLSSGLHEPPGGCGEVNSLSRGIVAPSVEAFDKLINSMVAEFLKNSRVLAGDVETHAEMVHGAFQAQRAFLLMVSQHQQPQENEVAVLLKPISEKIQEIQTFRERNRGSDMFNHLSAVSESIAALGWIAVSPKPGPYVKEMNDAATFYTNRVLRDYKHSDLRHVDWVRSYLKIWSELQAYIKEHHTTGLTWSKTGPVASTASAFSILSSGPGLPPPPPPPPPPGPPPPFENEGGKEEPSPSRSALFAQLNQGEAITKGLRHVTDDKKIYKNPSLRAQGQIRSPTKTRTPSPTSSKSNSPQKHAPVLELEGKKWRVEYQEDRNDLVISETELKQVAYIFKCDKSTLQIKGKVNSITVDNCKKFGLVFDHVVGIVEVINSKDIQIQVMGRVPTISTSQKWPDPWKPSEILCEKLQVLERSKGEEHDRWAVHFDSFKSHPGSQSRLSSQLTPQHLESLCVSPDTQELADVSSVDTPPPAVQVKPSEKEQRARPVMDMSVSHGQKTNFLRSMTALLDPAQIEERERRRQKQLEHQKAITAQVEENRRKKRLVFIYS